MESDDLIDELKALRVEIDAIDGQVIELLSERFKRTRRIGEIKKAAKLDPVDSSRENVIYERIRERAKSEGLNPEVAEQLWRLLIAQAIAEHRSIMDLDSPE